MTMPVLLSQWIFAQQAEDAAAAVFVIIMLIIVLVLVVAMLALVAYVYYILYTSLDAVPPEFRTMEPGMIFLMLVPCFNLVWIFFVASKIPESFRNYFWAKNDQRYGDCGAAVGMWWAVLTVINCIPYLNILTSIPTLICLILFLVKVNEMKNAVKASVGEGTQYAAGGVTPGYGDPNNPYGSPGEKY